MKSRLQFGKWLAALGLCAALAVPGVAEQRGRANSQNRPPKQQRQERQQQQQQKQDRQAQREAQRNTNRPPQSDARSRPENRSTNPNRPQDDRFRPNNLNRPPNAYTPPQRRNFNSLNPQEKQRALNNYKDYERRTPAERQQIQKGERVWSRLSNEQKAHIKNEIAPKWRQLPPDRQRAIRSRLNVLQNMPESARNQHLSDPNFTRGMNDEDRAMLHDLAHMHVGGAPEPPPNE
jgi:hypothetical protein